MKFYTSWVINSELGPGDADWLAKYCESLYIQEREVMEIPIQGFNQKFVSQPGSVSFTTTDPKIETLITLRFPDAIIVHRGGIA